MKLSDDGKKVRVVIDNLRRYHVHEITVQGIRSLEGNAVLHPVAYYTLNNIPAGAKLPASELSTKRSAAAKTPAKPAARAATASRVAKAPTYAEIEPLLVKNTCTACHQTTKRQVGPAYADIAKRKYSNERIVELIYNPEPKNWPEHETPMPPMPQVPRDEALKIASWINSLNEPMP